MTKHINNSGIQAASQYVPVGVGIYTGNPRQQKSLTEIGEQLSVVKKYNYGYSLFCWEYLFTPLHSSSNKEREVLLGEI